jgi:3-phenylpropionate/trans-cinnamate dioxygenase ferredoxin subunit
MGWVFAAGREELAESGRIWLKAGGQALFLLMAGGEVFALKNECPHLGCTMHRGKLDGYLLWCPCHDWVFDVRTGEFTVAPEIRIPVYPVKTEGDSIMVNTEVAR